MRPAEGLGRHGKVLMVKVKGKADYTRGHDDGEKRNHVLENPPLALSLTYLLLSTNTHTHPIRST